MALFLIYDHDNTIPGDSVRDRRGCYKTGDIVEVFDDSRHDGNIVANPIAPPFYLVKVAGLDVELVRHAMASEYNVLDPTETLTRRLYRLNISELPTQRRNELLANRYLEVTVAQARSWIRNKVTDAGV